MIGRRDFLKTSGLGALGFAAGRAWPQNASHVPTPLGELAKAKGILFGCALNGSLLHSNPAYAELASRECRIVTPENAMKWEALQSHRGQWTFEQADEIASFSQKHSILLRGHTFCWHRALPPWVLREVNPSNAKEVLSEHIQTVAGRYKGKIHSWDVANEVIQISDGVSGGWRRSFWYQTLGTEYMDVAYHATRAADPDALLVYNDYGLEYDNNSTIEKRKALLKILRGMKERGVPIDAIGMQSHLRAGTGETFGPGLPRFIKEVQALGLQVYVTELDVEDRDTSDTGDRGEAIAEVYARFLDAVLGTCSVPVVITWGLWERPSKNVTLDPGMAQKAPPQLLFAPDGERRASAQAVAGRFRNACDVKQAPRFNMRLK